MFAIGMELDIGECSVKIEGNYPDQPYQYDRAVFFGMLTAYYVYGSYAHKGTPFLSFALFIGIAMSITAFPVLARIIQEKG